MKNIMVAGALTLLLSIPIRGSEVSITDRNGVVQVVKALKSFTMYVDDNTVALYVGDSQDRLFGSSRGSCMKANLVWCFSFCFFYSLTGELLKYFKKPAAVNSQ